MLGFGLASLSDLSKQANETTVISFSSIFLHKFLVICEWGTEQMSQQMCNRIGTRNHLRQSLEFLTLQSQSKSLVTEIVVPFLVCTK